MAAALALSNTDWSRQVVPPVARNAEPQPSRCTSRSNVVEQVKSYEFFGNRSESAGRSLRQRMLVSSDYAGRETRFTGQTDWHIEWRACFEPIASGCRIGGVTTTVNVAYTMPQWADRDDASAQLRARWDRYFVNLTAHEKGHGEIAGRIARMIEQSLVGRTTQSDCDMLGSDAGAIVDEIMQRGEELQREYDRTTGHGTTQGAHFPF